MTPTTNFKFSCSVFAQTSFVLGLFGYRRDRSITLVIKTGISGCAMFVSSGGGPSHLCWHDKHPLELCSIQTAWPYQQPGKKTATPKYWEINTVIRDQLKESVQKQRL